MVPISNLKSRKSGSAMVMRQVNKNTQFKNTQFTDVLTVDFFCA